MVLFYIMQRVAHMLHMSHLNYISKISMVGKYYRTMQDVQQLSILPLDRNYILKLMERSTNTDSLGVF